MVAWAKFHDSICPHCLTFTKTKNVFTKCAGHQITVTQTPQRQWGSQRHGDMRQEAQQTGMWGPLPWNNTHQSNSTVEWPTDTEKYQPYVIWIRSCSFKFLWAISAQYKTEHAEKEYQSNLSTMYFNFHDTQNYFHDFQDVFNTFKLC